MTPSQWPREANLTLAQLYQGGEGGNTVAGLAANLSKVFGQHFTPDNVARQIDILRLDPRVAKPQNFVGYTGEWQPDALALLKANPGMKAKNLADLIQQQTGQVTNKDIVGGRRARIREEKMRAELAEDLDKAK
jgi:hypothetical protein